MLENVQNRMLSLKANCASACLLGSMLLVSACSTTVQAPDTIYYLLDSNPQSNVAKQATAGNTVMVDVVGLPDYLKTNQLVMKDGEHRLVKANYHSWADALDESIQRAVINDLNGLLTNKSVVDHCARCIRIVITVEHFYPSSSGDVLLSGYYQIATVGEEGDIHYFHFNEAMKANGYAHSVKQMRNLVSKLSAKLSISF